MRMKFPFWVIYILYSIQGSVQQIDKKQFVNLGDSFELEGNGGIEDGFSRALSDTALGGELGNENGEGTQMHITENSQGGLSLGESNGDGLGALSSLLGGNSINSFSQFNGLGGGSDDLGLGGALGGNSELSGKDDSLLESLGGLKDMQGGGAQSLSQGSNEKSSDPSEMSSLLSAFGLGTKGTSKSEAGGENSADSLLGGLTGGDKQQSLLSLLSLGDSSDNGEAKGGQRQTTSENNFDGLNLDSGNSNNNIESTANLGDSLTTDKDNDMFGLGKEYLGNLLGGSSLGGLASNQKGSKQTPMINDGSLGILQKLLSGAGATNGGDRQGIGDFGDGALSNELSQLDMSDEKLEKMLENGKIDGGDSEEQDHGPDTQAQFDAQQSQEPDELPSMGYHGMNMQQMPPSLSGMMTGMDPYGGMGGGMLDGMPHHNSWRPIQTGVTVHAHASDNPGHSTQISPADAAKTALAAKEQQARDHKEKLQKLKGRLKILKQKLESLEDEQSKKSHNVNSPAARRKDAIKKLLIKNLKLAALIASKEIQLEEAKDQAFTSRKKDADDLALVDTPSNLKESKDSESVALSFSLSKAKPLTDLSKKAEEEVNHLTKGKGKSTIAKTQQKSTPSEKQVKAVVKKVTTKSDLLKRINETLAKLNASSPKNATVSPIAYSRLVQRIKKLSPKKSEAVQEAALTSLYKALMKSKTASKAGNNSKLKIDYINVGCYKDKEKRLLSSLESSFKSPLDKNYKTRLNASYKCARLAKLKGFPGFALENGGQCFGGKAILKNYRLYGRSLACNKSGKGGPWSLDIYKFL